MYSGVFYNVVLYMHTLIISFLACPRLSSSSIEIYCLSCESTMFPKNKHPLLLSPIFPGGGIVFFSIVHLICFLPPYPYLLLSLFLFFWWINSKVVISFFVVALLYSEYTLKCIKSIIIMNKNNTRSSNHHHSSS
jgi:hypothetical protein